MMFKQIETAALRLTESQRAQLAQSLLLSLEENAEDAGHDEIWAEEAAKRFCELRETPTAGLPAEQVFWRLRSAVG